MNTDESVDALRTSRPAAMAAFHGYICPVHVRGVKTVDRLIVGLDGDRLEIDLVLLGLRMDAPPDSKRAMDGADWIEAAVRAAGSRGTVYLPRPRHVAGFVGSLAVGGTWAGVLYLTGQTESLNARAAAAQICGVDDACQYLHSGPILPRVAA